MFHRSYIAKALGSQGPKSYISRLLCSQSPFIARLRYSQGPVLRGFVFPVPYIPQVHVFLSFSPTLLSPDNMKSTLTPIPILENKCTLAVNHTLAAAESCFEVQPTVTP